MQLTHPDPSPADIKAFIESKRRNRAAKADVEPYGNHAMYKSTEREPNVSQTPRNFIQDYLKQDTESSKARIEESFVSSKPSAAVSSHILPE
jgi:hypothetical protein